MVEHAGNASFHSRDPSDPLSALQLDTEANWNTDMGATSHMTLHRHWLRNYTPKHIPIQLVDNTMVYSAGVGSVVFHPTLGGKRGSASRPLELVHSDVHALPYPSFSGYRYWVTFIDDYSRYCFLLPIKAKSDVFDTFKQFKVFAERTRLKGRSKHCEMTREGSI